MVKAFSDPDSASTARTTTLASEVHALRDFAELSADWFWEQDAEFRFIRFFGRATEKLRRKESDFFGKRRWDLPIHGVTPEQLSEHIATYERHEAFHDFDYEVPGVGGKVQYYSVSGTPVFDAQGVFLGYHGVGRNVTELRRGELAIKASEHQLSQIVDGSPIPTFVLNAEHRVTHWNRACEKLTGLNAKEMLGQSNTWRAFYTAPRPCIADFVVSSATDEEIARSYEQFSHSSLIAGAVEAQGFFPLMGDGGHWLYFTAAPLRDAQGKLTGAMETLQDITDQKRAQSLLEQLAARDGLTGIANRRRFDEKLVEEWKRACRDMRPLSLLMMDVDHFKLFNDSYGHLAGDLCLQRIAGALQQVVCRPADLVARYGGEEFVAILSATDSPGAAVVAQRILDHVRELRIAHNANPGGHVSLSIGVATVIAQADRQPGSLTAVADAALYRAKHDGRGRYVVY